MAPVPDLFKIFINNHEELSPFVYEYTKEAADAGDLQANYDLGMIYLNKPYKSISEMLDNHRLARTRFIIAAEKGHQDARLFCIETAVTSLIIPLATPPSSHEKLIGFLESLLQEGRADAQMVAGKFYDHPRWGNDKSKADQYLEAANNNPNISQDLRARLNNYMNNRDSIREQNANIEIRCDWPLSF